MAGTCRMSDGQFDDEQKKRLDYLFKDLSMDIVPSHTLEGENYFLQAWSVIVCAGSDIIPAHNFFHRSAAMKTCSKTRAGQGVNL